MCQHGCRQLQARDAGAYLPEVCSDAFEARQQELITLFRDVGNPDNIYAMSRDGYDSDEEYAQAIADELEVEDYYTEKNIFWVPKAARWDTLKNKAMLPTGGVITLQ